MDNYYKLFIRPGIQNTVSVFECVNKYITNNKVTKIVLSSTTGYTVYKAEEVLDYHSSLIVCKQDISEEFSMKKEIYEDIKIRHEIYDIPVKYLQQKVGLGATDILRKVSQGFKVCIEIMEYMLEHKLLEVEDELVVVAGTLKGADTAIVTKMVNKNKYTIERILCHPI